MGDLSKEEIKKIKLNIPKRIGLVIQKKRVEKGLTQVELAHRIQSDRQYLYKIESGKVGVSVVKLIIIAKALDLSPSELLEDIS